MSNLLKVLILVLTTSTFIYADTINFNVKKKPCPNPLLKNAEQVNAHVNIDCKKQTKLTEKDYGEVKVFEGSRGFVCFLAKKIINKNTSVDFKLLRKDLLSCVAEAKALCKSAADIYSSYSKLFGVKCTSLQPQFYYWSDVEDLPDSIRSEKDQLDRNNTFGIDEKFPWDRTFNKMLK